MRRLLLFTLVTGLLAPHTTWARASTDRVPVLTFPLLGPVVPVEGATSTLTRNDNGVTVRVRTNSLSPGDAITLWMAVFNYPDACTNPTEISMCSDPDLANPEVVGDVMYVSGNVVGNSGRASFAGRKSIGENDGSIFVPLLPPGVQPAGLQNPRGAEIHVVVHTHGEMLPEYMPSMIQTFGGGCQDPGAPFIGLHFPEWGEQGPNTCLSLQFAVHEPN